MGYDPVMRVTGKEKEVVIEEKGKKKTIETEDALQVLTIGQALEMLDRLQ